ncbi:MAG: Flp pilus assembly complex ATPase component TadA, partial [Chloroflexi bacterium]|nr:Flp pilus assembly complex ATPase component TadA [Chloroflexota bacterium]
MSLLRRISEGQATGQGAIPAPGSPASGALAEDQSRLAALRERRAVAQTSGGGSPRDTLTDLKSRVQNKLLSELDPSMDVSRTGEVRKTIEDLFETILAEENLPLSRTEKRRLLEQIMAEILGLGPLEALLNDDSLTEVMVNGARNIYVERKGKLLRVPVTFESDDHLMRIIERIVAPLGRRIDEASPYVDARLQDGSRVNAVIPPISLVGPVLTIRKFSRVPITVDDLINFGAITPEAMEFMKACVTSRLNIVISGGTGSGKTTFLNVLSSFIPEDERIVTIED